MGRYASKGVRTILLNEAEFGQMSGLPGYFQTTAMLLRTH